MHTHIRTHIYISIYEHTHTHITHTDFLHLRNVDLIIARNIDQIVTDRTHYLPIGQALGVKARPSLYTSPQ